MKDDYKRIKISDLTLDNKNPRLPKSKQNSLDEGTIIDWMLLEAATLELMLAIGKNGFFSGEQLLVVPDDKNKGKYIVIEGNRRLTAVKLLSNPNLATVKKQGIKEIIESTKERPSLIPCLVFDDKNEILKYLGFRHITGIKAWRLLEKSRYLSDLRKEQFSELPFKIACGEIAKIIGSSSAYIKRLLISFELYKIVEDEDFYSIEGLNDSRFHLSYFVDSLNKNNIRNYLGVNVNSDNPLKNINTDNLREICYWWFEKNEGLSRVIGDSSGLKALDSVIGNKNALKAFRAGANINDAIELTNDLNILFKKEIEKALKSVENADSLSNRITEFYDNLYDDLKNIRKIANKINEFKNQIEKDKDDF